jgi:hypothetical protein
LDIGPAELNRLVGIPGFAEICPTDWLEIINADAVKLPNYQTHNGVEAKRKAMTQRRVERHRKRVNAPVTLKALPDQDQTRPDQDHKDKGQPADRFPDYWVVLPKEKKVKKKTAHAIWKRKKLDAIADKIIRDVETRKKTDRRWLEGFIPDPTTYLNGERWNDEIDASQPKGAKPEWAAIPGNNEALWGWAQKHGYSNPGTRNYFDYRRKLEAEVEARLNKGGGA